MAQIDKWQLWCGDLFTNEKNCSPCIVGKYQVFNLSTLHFSTSHYHTMAPRLLRPPGASQGQLKELIHRQRREHRRRVASLHGQLRHGEDICRVKRAMFGVKLVKVGQGLGVASWRGGLTSMEDVEKQVCYKRNWRMSCCCVDLRVGFQKSVGGEDPSQHWDLENPLAHSCQICFEKKMYHPMFLLAAWHVPVVKSGRNQSAKSQALQQKLSRHLIEHVWNAKSRWSKTQNQPQ